jgi:hypothetical protein
VRRFVTACCKTRLRAAARIGALGVLLAHAACARPGTAADDGAAEPAREVPSAQPAQSPTAAEPATAARTPAATSSPDMARIRDAVTRAPEEALALIERDDASHAGDAHAEERAWLKVDALVAMQQIGRARAAAEDFLRRYPRSAQAARIRALTGVHPRPLGPRE